MDQMKIVSLFVIFGISNAGTSSKNSQVSGFVLNKASVNFICGANSSANATLADDSIAMRNEYRTITFENCQFPTDVPNFFQKFHDVRTLSMIDVDIQKFDGETLQNVTKLQNLIVSNNQIDEIKSRQFSNAPNLEFVSFSNNSIERIDLLAFAGVTNLKKLDLSNNKLTCLDLQAFVKLINLNYLDLSYNPIGKLNVDTFAHLKELKVLLLKQTNIATIQPGTFAHQKKLMSLDLSENKLKIFDINVFYLNTGNLQTFYINQNKQIGFQSFADLYLVENMQSLYLYKNQLIELNGFRSENFPQLQLLDINDNKFNCSYLQRFMESFNSEAVRFHSGAQSKNANGVNIHGISCTTETSTNINACSESNPNGCESSYDILIRSLLIVLCIFTILILLLILFLGRRQLFRCCNKTDNYAVKDSSNQQKIFSNQNMDNEINSNQTTIDYTCTIVEQTFN